MNKLKCGTVSSAAVAQYGRLDAEFYLGRERALLDKIERAERRFGKATADVALANAAIKSLKAELRAERKRVARMVKAGEVMPL